MPDRLRLSVVVPHLNQPEALERCLRSIWQGRRAPDEVTVVDNGSAEMPQAVCAAFPGTRLLQERTPGPGPARNMGAAASSGDVIAFIDADCVADPGWLAGVEAAFADPEVQIAGGDVRVGVANPARMTEIEAYESIFGYQVERYIRDMGFTVTCNMAIRPPVMQAVGPMADIRIAEDRDWGQRATAMGYRIRYVPQMRIYHPARRDFAQLTKKWDRHMGHDFAEACDAPRGRLKFLVKTLAMAPSVLAELPKVLASDRVEGAGNRWRALMGLTRIRLYRARRMAWLVLGGDPAKLSGAWNRG